MELGRQLAASAIVLFARGVTAVRGIWTESGPSFAQRIYFANHSSHGDFILIWAVLPPRLRSRTRPVAAADYWLKPAWRRYIARQVFDAVLIERERDRREHEPVEVMAAALDSGSSLIVFPEGTRNQSEAKLLPFKSGLYHLARARPEVELVPVWIHNLNRVMPKGEFIPIPLICKVLFAPPIRLQPSESKEEFLARARQALLAVAPGNGDGRA